MKELNDVAYKTPLQDLLRAIPADLVIQYETDNNGFKVWHNCPIGRLACESIAALEAAEARIAELEAQVPKWVPVTERLPEDGVLVVAGDFESSGCQWVTHYESGVGMFLCEYPQPRWPVTHWMPLPAAPKEEA